MPSPATSAAQQTPETHLRALCARGWDIFPCKPIRGRKDWDKHPYTTNGHKDATSDIDTVLRWWRRWPDALIGYVPASGGHIVVDCNPGIDLADLPVEWLESRIVRTPSGSLHVYFAAQEGVEYAEGPRADLKALWPGIIDVVRWRGGYACVPPSAGYALIHDRDPIAAPDAFAEQPHAGWAKSKAAAESMQRGDVITNAQHLQLLYLARDLYGKIGDDEQTVADVLDSQRQQRFPDTDANDPWKREGPRGTDRIAHDAREYVHPLSRGAFPAGGGVAQPQVDPDQLVRTFDGIQTEQVRWLWHQRIPRGAVTILAGDPGLGKSMFTADLAARLSNGTRNGQHPLPDDGCTFDRSVPPMRTLICSAEDSATHVIKPRLIAAKADHRNVLWWDDSQHQLVFPESLQQFAAVLEAHKPDVVIIDPISAFLGAVDAWKDAEVRARVLRPMRELAEKYGCAIIIVQHLNKREGAAGLQRIQGSTGFVGAARQVIVWGVAPGTERRENKRGLAVMKSNYGLEGETLAVDILQDDNGQPYLEWQGKRDWQAEQLMQVAKPERDSEKRNVADFLRVLISDGETDSAVLIAACLAEFGCSKRTVQNAADMVPVRRDHLFGKSLWTLKESA